jgi:hypothetical protein
MVIKVYGYSNGNLWKRSRQHGIFAQNPALYPRRSAMGLYERLLEERAEEEQRLGRPSRMMRGLDSKVLDRRLEGSNRRPGYAAELSMLHRLITRGPRNAGEGMRLGSLKTQYRKEYGELKTEKQGQQELLQR